MNAKRLNAEEYDTRRVFILALGLIASLAGILLGAIWPSVFTLVALVILPAPFLFVWGMVDPSFVERARVRYYLIALVVLAAACFVWEAIYLSQHAT